MFKVALKSTWSHKRRLIGTVSAVVLGIAFLAGTLMLGDTMRAGFDDLFADATANTDAVVRGSTEIESDQLSQQALLDASVLDEVRAVDGVADAEAEIVGIGQVIGADGEAIGGNGPPTLATNWIDNSDLSTLELVSGDAAGGGRRGRDRLGDRRGRRSRHRRHRHRADAGADRGHHRRALAAARGRHHRRA